MKKEEIINVISEVLNRKVDENTSKEEIQEWDSLKHLQIIMEIEERFNVAISINDLSKINSVKDILNILKIS
ncbi:acyl carrier protein [Athalassotoga saccharophila]|uniref:acyl carrier protein n=1 Tax=Athalassotoga saccharophila TaxID=1441386 RepID=UPI00137B643A|nr:acyl carrier protein [Athalassotoga saccharophila]BBJ28317.1 acyl carrier protein [Athalassotoga saccharophila]